MPDDPVPLIHVIAQVAWHDPAFIVGNREGLKHLRKAIDAALSAHGAGHVDAFAEDGEGYGLHIRCVTDAEMESVPYGYTASDLCAAKAWPEWMKRAR